ALGREITNPTRRLQALAAGRFAVTGRCALNLRACRRPAFPRRGGWNPASRAMGRADRWPNPLRGQWMEAFRRGSAPAGRDADGNGRAAAMAQAGSSPPAPGAGVALRPARRDDLPAIVAMRDALNALELAGSPHAPIQRLTVDEFAALWGPTFDDPRHCWRVV